MTNLHSGEPFRVMSQSWQLLAIAAIAAGNGAVIRLLELITIHRVGGVSEVRDEIEILVNDVNIRAPVACAELAPGIGRETVAIALAAIRRIDETESIDLSGFHGAQRNLVHGGPATVITHERPRVALLVRAVCVLGEPIHFAQIFIEISMAVRLRLKKPTAGTVRRIDMK